MLAKKARGHRGVWFAQVEGNTFPVLHSYWYHAPIYHDVNLTPELSAVQPQPKRFSDQLRQGRFAILARSNPTDENDTLKSFRRKDYIGLFEYDFVSQDSDGLKLRFKKRVTDLR